MIRKFKTVEDYPTIAKWWVRHSWVPVPIQGLPGTGLVSEIDGKPVAAGWLFLSDSCMAWMEYMVGDPDSKFEDRDKGLDEVVEGLSDVARGLGYKIIMVSVGHKRLIDRYSKHDFKETDLNMVNMTRRL